MDQKPTTKKPEKRPRKWPARVSVGMLAILTVLYAARPDATTAITVWPAWVGMLLGIGVALFARQHLRWLAPLWLVFGLVFVEEFQSVPRGVLPAQPRDFRVVSLNCAGGSVLAAGEVRALRPDLVLLQESPSKPDLEKLARELFGEGAVVAWGPDATILGPKGLVPFARPRKVSNFVAARWEAAPGRVLDVVSLRLMPPVLRFDLYSPAAWQDYAQSRALRGEEMTEIWRQASQMGANPDLIGGDFNTPPDGAIQKGLTADMDDAFRLAGVGLGATCVNPYPCIVRIDQIWSSPRVQCVRAWVVRTENSDHRMLVADYRFR